MKRSGMLLAVLVGASLVLGPDQAHAASPTEALRTHVDHVLAVLRDATLKGPEATQQRRDTVRQVVDDVLDFRAMAERALGRHWAARTAEERAEFVALFSDLLETLYVTEIERHADHSVTYLSESRDGREATVATKIIGKSETRVDYRMHLHEGRWLVRDVVVGGLSIVDNFRSQLQRMLRDASYARLVDTLREATGGQAAAASVPVAPVLR